MAEYIIEGIITEIEQNLENTNRYSIKISGTEGYRIKIKENNNLKSFNLFILNEEKKSKANLLGLEETYAINKKDISLLFDAMNYGRKCSLKFSFDEKKIFISSNLTLKSLTVTME